MATTSSNLTAGKAIAGQAGDGRGYKGRAAGLVAAAALGVALLTGMVFSQARQEVQPTAGPAASIAQADGVERQLFLEQNTQLPIAGTSAFVPDQFTYREDHRQVAPVVAADTFVPDQFTYREDHRASAQATHGTGPADEYEQADRSATAFVADQFTYREDHRGELAVAFTPGRYRLWIYA